MDKLLLGFVGLFGPLYSILRVDKKHMLDIVRTKLIIDSRRSKSMSYGMQTDEKKNRNWITYVVYFFIGAFCAGLLYQINHFSSGLALYFLLWMVMLCFTLISDFTDVLFDLRDNYILLAQPVSDQTIAISRLVHIFIYLTKISIPFVIAAFVFIAIKKGILTTFLFTVQFLLSIVLSIFFVYIFYLLMLRFVSGEKFKRIINWFQIVFVSLILIGYYLLPTVLDFLNIDELILFNHSWAYFLPSTWIASIYETLLEGSRQPSILICALLAICTPFFGIWIITRFLTKQFNQKMISLGQGTAKTKSGTSVKQATSSYMNWWKNLVSSNPIEAGIFKFSWLMTGRSRDFKYRTYPMFALLPAMFVYFMFDDYGDISIVERYENLRQGNSYIFFIYLCLFAVISPLTNTEYSEKFKAAWIYYSNPIAKPGYILKANALAVFIKFGVPTFFIVSLITVFIWGIHTLDDVLIGMINMMLMFAIVSRSLYKRIPFSSSWSDSQRGDKFTSAFAIMFIIGIIGGIHYVLISIPFANITLGAIAIIITYFIYKSYDKVKWTDLVINNEKKQK